MKCLLAGLFYAQFLQEPNYFKVHRKRRSFLDSYQICTLKYMEPKFWSAGVKITDSRNAESCDISLSKVSRVHARLNLIRISSCGVNLLPKVCFPSFLSCRLREFQRDKSMSAMFCQIEQPR